MFIYLENSIKMLMFLILEENSELWLKKLIEKSLKRK